MAFWSGDRNGWRHQIMERFGYDPRRGPVSDLCGSILYLLKEDARSGLGLLREEPPTLPAFCDFAAEADPDEAFREARKAWQLAVCGLDRWTSGADVERGLMTRPKRQAV